MILSDESFQGLYTGFGISLLTLFSWLQIARHDNAQVPFFICHFQLVISRGIVKLFIGPAEMHHTALGCIERHLSFLRPFCETV